MINITNIVIIDQNTDLTKFNFSNYNDSKIITFDYDSHQILNKKNIQHLISDDFLSENDLLEIQKNAYLLSTWYKEESIENIVKYENVNLGSLIQSEFINILVNYSKRFVECLKIIEKFGSDINYVCGGLNYEIIQQFCSNITKIKYQNNPNSFFPLDTLNIKMKIGIKNFSKEINVSQNIFNQLKKISNESTRFLSNSKIDLNKKTILLSEFGTIAYESLFSEFLNSRLNGVVFNRRQPVIWNKKTLSIIKNSGIIIENESTLKMSKQKTKINDNDLLIDKKIKKMIENLDFFIKFFSIFDKSFWIPFSEHFIEYFRHRAKKFIHEIEISKEVLEKYEFSFILILSEVGPNEKILSQLGKSKKIPIVLLQHGLINDSIEGYEHNIANGVIPIESNLSIVWGNENKNYLKKIGVSKEKIHSLGTPLFDNSKKTELSLEKNYVLLATSGPTKEDAFDLTIKTIEKNIKTIEKIAHTVTKHKMKLIVKTHPSPDEFDPTEILKKINPDIKIVKTGKISELIKNCKLLIIIDESTAILNAHLLDIPVLSVSVKTEEFGIPTILKNNSCARANIQSFDDVFSQIINDHEFRTKLIQNANISTKNYISNLSNGAKQLINFLENN